MDALRFLVFEESLYTFEDPFLNALEQEALAEEVPIIRKDTQAFLRFLLTALAPKRILEIGTAVGFSAILMARYSDADILTMESYDKRIVKARENIRRAGLSHRITLMEGDAEASLSNMEGSFDLVFMDAAKGQYGVYYERVMPHLHSGSVVVADNVLFDGNILESKFAVERRDRTIHKRLREFLYDVCHDERMASVVLSVGDGLLLSVVKAEDRP